MAAVCADDERCLGASFYHPWTAEGAVAVLSCSGSLGLWPVQVKLVLLFRVWRECQGGVGQCLGQQCFFGAPTLTWCSPNYT